MRSQEAHARVRPPVIAIGGMDRAGKSTARAALMEYLEAQGYDPVYRWSRIGYTWRIEQAKRLLRRVWGGKARDAGAPRSYPQRADRLRSPWKRRLWTTLALLDLFWEYAITGRMLRARGRALVRDRWICDALVDFRVNFPDDRLEKRLMWRLLSRLALRPDASFLLLISADESLRRAHESGRRHVEPREALEARLLEYRRIAETGLGEVIDAARTPEAIVQDLRERLDAILHRTASSPPTELALRTK